MKTLFKALFFVGFIAVSSDVFCLVERAGEVKRPESGYVEDRDYDTRDDASRSDDRSEEHSDSDESIVSDQSHERDNTVGSPEKDVSGNNDDVSKSGNGDAIHADTPVDVKSDTVDVKVVPTVVSVQDSDAPSLARIQEELSKSFSISDIYTTLNQEVAAIMKRGREYLQIDISKPGAFDKIKAIMKQELVTLEKVVDMTTAVKSPDVRFELGRVTDRIVQLKEFLLNKELPGPLKRPDGRGIEVARKLGLHAMLPDEQRMILRQLYEQGDAQSLKQVSVMLEALRLQRDGRSLDPALEVMVDDKIMSKLSDPMVQGFMDAKIGRGGKVKTFLKRLGNSKNRTFEESSMRVLRTMKNKGDLRPGSPSSPSDFVQHTIDIAQEVGVDVIVDGPIIGLVVYEALPKLSEDTRRASEQVAAMGTLKNMGLSVNGDVIALLDPKKIQKDALLQVESKSWWQNDLQDTARVLADVVTRSKDVFVNKKNEFKHVIDDDSKNAIVPELLRAFQEYQEAQAMLLMNLIQKSEEHQQQRIIDQDPNGIMAKWFRDVFRAESKTKTFDQAEKEFLKAVSDNQKQEFARKLIDYTRGHVSDLIVIKNSLKDGGSDVSLDIMVKAALSNAIDEQVKLVLDGLQNGNGNWQ